MAPTTAKLGPNEPCACGSGKKFKHCCGHPDAVLAQATKLQRRRAMAIGAGVLTLVVILGVAAYLTQEDMGSAAPPPVTQLPPTAEPAESANSGVLYPQPPGPVPDGKYWNFEHGHWETGVPQPAGPVPAGMEWSVEHGHWHDILTGQAPKPPISPDQLPQ